MQLVSEWVVNLRSGIKTAENHRWLRFLLCEFLVFGKIYKAVWEKACHWYPWQLQRYFRTQGDKVSHNNGSHYKSKIHKRLRHMLVINCDNKKKYQFKWYLKA